MRKQLLNTLTCFAVAFAANAEALEIELNDYEPLNSGEWITLSVADVTGKAPYTYEWTDSKGDVIGQSETLSRQLTLPEVFTLKVTDANGDTGLAYAEVDVYGLKADATFEGIVPQGSVYWQGRVYDDPYMMTSNFYSGSFKFTNTYMPDYKFWGGFAVSESESNDFTPSGFEVGQFNCVPAKAAEGKGFCVSYPSMARAEITVLADAEGAVLESCQLTNNMYLYSSAVSGDSFNGAFKTGDFHKVIFTGDDPAGTPVEFYLADMRSDNTESHFIVSDWRKCDLTPLGRVKKVTVKVESSNPYVPSYFCMDNLRYHQEAGVSSVTAADNAEPRYFDLQGREVTNPSSGWFIEVRGTSARKIRM